MTKLKFIVVTLILLNLSPINWAVLKSPNCASRPTSDRKHCGDLCANDEYNFEGRDYSRYNEKNDPDCFTIDVFPIYMMKHPEASKRDLVAHVRVRLNGDCPLKEVPKLWVLGAILHRNEDQMGHFELINQDTIGSNTCTDEDSFVLQELPEQVKFVQVHPCYASYEKDSLVVNYQGPSRLTGNPVGFCALWKPHSTKASAEQTVAFRLEAKFITEESKYSFDSKQPYVLKGISPWYKVHANKAKNHPSMPDRPFECHKVDDNPIYSPVVFDKDSYPRPTTTTTTTTEATTTVEPTTTTELATTTSEPITTTELATTTSEPITTTELATTTSEPLTTTELATTTSEPLTTTELATTTSEPLTTTELAATTSESLTTTELITTTLSTTSESTTTTKPHPPVKPPVIPAPPPPPPGTTRKPPTEDEKEEADRKKEEMIEHTHKGCGGYSRCFAGVKLKASEMNLPSVEIDRQDGCIPQGNCEFFVAYGKQQHDETVIVNSDELMVQMYGVSNDWIALGFSKDQCMGQDFVVECVNSDSEILVFTSWNINRGTNKRNSEHEYTSHIQLVQGFIYGRRIFCAFKLKKTIYAANQTFHFDRTAYYALMGTGLKENLGSSYFGKGGNLNQPLDRWVSFSKYVFASKFGPDEDQQNLIFWHGYLMFFVWLVIVPFSTFYARFYQESYVSVRIYGIKLWKFVHVTISLIALVIIFIAHVILAEANRDWSLLVELPATRNTKLWFSLFASSGYFFNIVTGLLSRESRIRTSCSCNMMHSVIGHASYACALGAIYSSTNLLYSYLPCSVNHVVLFWIVAYHIFLVAVTYHSLWVDHVFKLIYGNMLRRKKSLERPEAEYLRNRFKGKVDAPGRRIRKVFLVIFLVLSFSCFSACIYLMTTSERTEACFTLDQLNIESQDYGKMNVVPPRDCNLGV